MTSSLFSIQRPALSKDEIKKSRQIAIDGLCGLRMVARRSYAQFLARSILVVPTALLTSWVSGLVPSFKIEFGLRIAFVCLICTWLLYWLHKGYEAHQGHERESAVMQSFYEQLKPVSFDVQQAFAQEHLFVYEIVNYLQQVERAERLLTEGELAMLQAYADTFHHGDSQVLSVSYI